MHRQVNAELHPVGSRSVGYVVGGSFFCGGGADGPGLVVDAIGIRLCSWPLDALSALVVAGLGRGVNVDVAEGRQILVGGIGGKADVGVGLANLIEAAGVFVGDQIEEGHGLGSGELGCRWSEIGGIAGDAFCYAEIVYVAI